MPRKSQRDSHYPILTKRFVHFNVFFVEFRHLFETNETRRLPARATPFRVVKPRIGAYLNGFCPRTLTSSEKTELIAASASSSVSISSESFSSIEFNAATEFQ